VDTSAWISSFRSSGSSDLKEFLRKIVHSRLAATCAIIKLELVYGCRTREEYSKLTGCLEAQHDLDFDPGVWLLSYETAFSLRRRGITVPAVDILIAALAAHHQVLLVHHDAHFEIIKEALPALKTINFLSS